MMMNNVNNNNEKISVKNFNDFFENDQPSRAFSRLAERQLKKLGKNQRKYFRYNRDELLAIRQYPTSKMTQTEFYSRLKNPELDDTIIKSFQRKCPKDLTDFLNPKESRSINKNSNDVTKSNNRSYNNCSSLMSNTNNNNNLNESSIKVYNRYNKYNIQSESGHSLSSGSTQQQSWRTDRHSPNFRPNMNNRDNNSTFAHRNSNRRHNENHRNRYERDSLNNDVNKNEPEPEWFSDGPKSMTDFIDLKGFDDDNGDGENENYDSNDDDDDYECNNNNNNNNDSTELFDEKLQKLLKEDLSSSINDQSKEDDLMNSFFDTTNDISLLNQTMANDDFSKLFVINSSRSTKWFKSRLSNANDNQNSSTPASNQSLVDLFRMKNIDINQLPQMKQIDLSQAAINVSELEASLSSSNNHNNNNNNNNISDTISSSSSLLSLTSSNNFNKPSGDDSEIISKLKFLASPVPQQQLQPPPPPPSSLSSSSQTPINFTLMNNNNEDSNKLIDPLLLQAMFERKFSRTSPATINLSNDAQQSNRMNFEISDLNLLQQKKMQQQSLQSQQPSMPPLLDGFPFPSSMPANAAGVRPVFAGIPHPVMMGPLPLNPIVPNVPLNQMQFTQPLMMFPNSSPMIHTHPIRPLINVGDKHNITPQPPLSSSSNMSPHGILSSHLLHMAPSSSSIRPSVFPNNDAASLDRFQNTSNNQDNYHINSSQQQQDNSNSMANKLLKNSKLTPTSVFRKLKEHENKAKIIKNQTNDKNGEPNDSIKESQNDEKNMAYTPKNLSEMTNLLMQQLNISNNNNQSSQKNSSTTINSNDIFKVFNTDTNNELIRNDRKNTNIDRLIDLPPLPLHNALTLEDLEKL